jgi:hypothetical protein
MEVQRGLQSFGPSPGKRGNRRSEALLQMDGYATNQDLTA